MTKQTIKHWWERFKSPTSEDFKWLRLRANYVGATALAIIGLGSMPMITIPAGVVTVCTYLLIAAVAVTGTSSFTKQPNNDTDEEA